MGQTKKKRILVAASAENASSFGDCAEFLRDEGFEVDFVATVPELLQVMLSGQADLVIVYCGPLDLVGEGLERKLRKPRFRGNRAGFNTVALARRRGSQIPALFLISGWSPARAVPKTAFCEIPLPLESLLEVVQATLTAAKDEDWSDAIFTLAMTKTMMRRDSGRFLL